MQCPKCHEPIRVTRVIYMGHEKVARFECPTCRYSHEKTDGGRSHITISPDS